MKWHQCNCLHLPSLSACQKHDPKQQSSLQEKCMEVYRTICVTYCNTLALGCLPTLLIPWQVNGYCDILTAWLRAAFIISSQLHAAVVIYVPSCSICKDLDCKATYWLLNGVYMHHTESMYACACRHIHRSWQLAWWRNLCLAIKAICIDGQQKFLAWWVHSQT